MDLLGSILSKMDKPPSMSEKQRMIAKKHKEAIVKQQLETRKKLKEFREQIESRIKSFMKDGEQKKLAFEPMSKVERSIIRDVTEVAGIIIYTFGEEDVDRHIVIYKPEFAPCEDELTTLRRGEEWTPEKAKELAQKREMEKQLQTECTKEPEKFVPTTNYKEKYEHLIGKDAALAAARKTEMNKQYGFVPSANKRDNRSIEQTLADIKSKKRQKTSDNPETVQ